MSLRINKFFASKFPQWVLYKSIRLYSLTFRLEVQNEAAWLDAYLNDNKRIILCTHHQQFFAAIRYFQKYKAYKPGLMISQSKDGELISAVANRSGWTTVRGSSTRGGVEALKGMIDHLTEHRLAAHIIDGPRGPFGVVKPGAIRLAHEGETVIIPFYIHANHAWYARSWDRFLLPKPGSKVILRFGDEMNFPKTETSEAFEEQRSNLERVMGEKNRELQEECAQAV
ncbi:lysophospholipid acyltransferase family protein [Desulfoluna sp.]|uniref:lysophospholipid acyltransferase family protein n=1 Tax=Desulfoluna sp. TaxID=2045199 RepID=UPI002606CBAD|nr:lysophospholipid acyltransferase family protein [Desulfoluna sp.]